MDLNGGFVCFPLVFLSFSQAGRGLSVCFVVHMCSEQHIWRIDLFIFLPQLMVCWTLGISCQLPGILLSVAGVSMSHAAFHYMFIGF